jgi:hypothetical protein
MGSLVWRKRINMGNGMRLNLSARGASVSERIGNATVNSRGGESVRLPNGMTYRVAGRRY